MAAHPVVLQHQDDLTLDNQDWQAILRPLVYRCDWATQQGNLSEAARIENGFRKDHVAPFRPAPRSTMSHIDTVLRAAAVQHIQDELEVGAMLSVHVTGASREIEDVGSKVEHRHSNEARTAIPAGQLALCDGVAPEPSLAVALPKHEVHGLVLQDSDAVQCLSLEDFAAGDACLKNHVFIRFAVPRPSKLKGVKQTSGLTTGFDHTDSLVVLQDALDVHKDERSVSVMDRHVQSSFDELGVWSLPEINHKNLRLSLVL